MLRLKHYRGQEPGDLFRLSRARRAQYHTTRLSPGQAIERFYERRGWPALILGVGRDKHPRHWRVTELELRSAVGMTYSQQVRNSLRRAGTMQGRAAIEKLTLGQ